MADSVAHVATRFGSREPKMSRHALDERSLELVRVALDGLRFGEVVIAVHDGEIVQVSRTEKLRPPKPPR